MITLSRLMLDPMSRRVQTELAKPYEMHRTLCHAFPRLSSDEWKAARVLFRADEDNGRLSLLVQSQIKPDWRAFVEHLNGARYLLDKLGAPQCTAWKSVQEQLEEKTFRLKQGEQLRFRLQANPTYSPIIAGQTSKKGRPKSKRVGLYSEAERLDWLHRQGERLGFSLEYPRNRQGEIELVSLKIHEVIRNGNIEMDPPMFRGRPYEGQELQLPLCEVVDLNSGPLKNKEGRIQPHSEPTRRTRQAPMPRAFESLEEAKPRRVTYGSSEFSAALFNGTLTVTDPENFAKAIENGIGPAKGFGFGLLSVAPVTK